jgi:hypothetical protein
VVSVFECRTVGGAGGLSVLYADPSFSCGTPEHTALVRLGGALYALYCVGVPAHIAAILWWVRRRHAKKLAGKRVGATLGFFYLDKKPRMYNYELAVAFRKLSIVTLVGVMNGSPGYQMIVATTVMWVYFGINIRMDAYAYALVTELESATLAACALTYTVSCLSYVRTLNGESNTFARGRAAFAALVLAANIMLIVVLGGGVVAGLGFKTWRRRAEIRAAVEKAFAKVAQRLRHTTTRHLAKEERAVSEVIRPTISCSVPSNRPESTSVINPMLEL